MKYLLMLTKLSHRTKKITRHFQSTQGTEQLNKIKTLHRLVSKCKFCGNVAVSLHRTRNTVIYLKSKEQS